MRTTEDLAVGLEREDLLRLKLNRETARIPWRDLQRFFAQGRAIWVQRGLDLIEVALWVAQDDAAAIAAGMTGGSIGQVPERQARYWFETQASLWAVVVKPWVLVQETGAEAAPPSARSEMEGDSERTRSGRGRPSGAR